MNSSYSGCWKFSKRVNSCSQVSLMSPMGPLRCLRISRSAWPFTRSRSSSFVLVVLFAVNEHHDVGVLLDGARFAQVAELRPVVARGFDLAIELRQAQHRHVQLAGQPFQAARDAGDLLLPRIARVVGLDELQVVDRRPAPGRLGA